jgi:hypothetical protein
VEARRRCVVLSLHTSEHGDLSVFVISRIYDGKLVRTTPSHSIWRIHLVSVGIYGDIAFPSRNTTDRDMAKLLPCTVFVLGGFRSGSAVQLHTYDPPCAA